MARAGWSSFLVDGSGGIGRLSAARSAFFRACVPRCFLSKSTIRQLTRLRNDSALASRTSRPGNRYSIISPPKAPSACMPNLGPDNRTRILQSTRSASTILRLRSYSPVLVPRTLSEGSRLGSLLCLHKRNQGTKLSVLTCRPVASQKRRKQERDGIEHIQKS